MLTIRCRMHIGLSVTYFIHDRNCTVIYDDGHALPPAWQPSCGIRSHRFAHEQLIQVLPRISKNQISLKGQLTSHDHSYSVLFCISLSLHTNQDSHERGDLRLPAVLLHFEARMLMQPPLVVSARWASNLVSWRPTSAKDAPLKAETMSMIHHDTMYLVLTYVL